jgi:hypothetical protein
MWLSCKEIQKAVADCGESLLLDPDLANAFQLRATAVTGATTTGSGLVV